MKIKLILLLFLTALYGYSQNTVSGKIIDSSGQPLFGATVSITNTSKATITDENGRYLINNIPTKKCFLKTSYMGYTPEVKEISFNKDKKSQNFTANFILKEKIESLQQVNLQAKTEKVKKETKGFAVNVIETKEASIRNIQTNELLNTTVGVKIRQNGGLGSGVQYSLNGLSGRSVSIFIDGIPISMYGSSFSLNSIPPAMIKNIEVYKGVVPGHLSSDALGGAINIILHKGAKTNLNASVSYGSFNTFQSNLNGLYRFSKSGFTVKASAFYNYSDNDYKVWGDRIKHIEIDGSQTPITARRFNDAYKSKGGMAEFGFTNVKWADQFFIGFTASDDYKEIQHGAFMTIHPYNDRFRETDAQLANLTYQKKNLFIKGLDLKVNGLYGKRNTAVTDTSAYAYTWKGVRLLRKDYQNEGEIIEHQYPWGSQQEGGPTLARIKRNVASVRTGLSYTINDNHKILLNHAYSGVDREDYDKINSLLENTFRQTSDLYKNIYALSYELNAFEEKLKISPFAKYYHQKVLHKNPVFNDDQTEVIKEIYQSDKNYTGYGFAASYAVTPNITLLSSAEKAVRLPSETEVFGDVGENVIPNLSVQPEISNNYNFGFRFGKFFIKKHAFTVSTNLFSRNIKDLIGLPTGLDDSGEDDELVQYGNFNEKTTSRGVDIDLNYSYNNNLSFNFNLSRLSLKTKNRAGQKVDVANVPLFTMNAGVRYSIANGIQKNSRLNLFYNAYYTDEFQFKLAQGSNTIDEGAYLIPEQLSQDFGLSYVFPKENFVLSFDAKNIFNKAVYDNRSVQKPGRAFYLKLNYTINKF